MDGGGRWWRLVGAGAGHSSPFVDGGRLPSLMDGGGRSWMVVAGGGG